MPPPGHICGLPKGQEKGKMANGMAVVRAGRDWGPVWPMVPIDAVPTIGVGDI
jgi:hypothetical protein